MQLGIVIGHATATVKHASMTGLRLVLVQPLGVTREPEADALLVVDKLGSGPGDTVILNSDGKSARDLVGNDKTPVRWHVVGIVDD